MDVNPKLRVAHVTLGLDVGGQEKLLVEFARHADRERFDLHFVSLTSRGQLAGDLEACGWPVTALDAPAGLRPRIVWRLARLFRRERLDVVHTHDDRPLIHGAPAARLARVRRVIHMRHGRSARLGRKQLAAVNLAARLTDEFVCVSEDSARLTVRQGAPAAKVSAVWNGIDVDRFAYAGPRPGGPAVLVARMSWEKDVPTLLRAAALAVRACPTFRLEIAGNGTCLPELKRLAAELDLGPAVQFLGEVRDVAALLERCSQFVLSSVTEGVSLTLLEAMARGLPVVATAVGGNAEVVVDGETGLLVPAQSPAELAHALLRLHRDPEAARRFGAAGRQRVEGSFDIRRMVRRYEELYRGRKPVVLVQRPYVGAAAPRAAVPACPRGAELRDFSGGGNYR